MVDTDSTRLLTAIVVIAGFNSLSGTWLIQTCWPSRASRIRPSFNSLSGTWLIQTTGNAGDTIDLKWLVSIP